MTNEQQVQITRNKPLFADKIIVEVDIKINKKNKEDREFHVRLIFIDTKTTEAVSEVVLSRLTARDLQKILNETMEKLDEIIKTGKLPQRTIKASSNAPDYMG